MSGDPLEEDSIGPEGAELQLSPPAGSADRQLSHSQPCRRRKLRLCRAGGLHIFTSAGRALRRTAVALCLLLFVLTGTRAVFAHDDHEDCSADRPGDEPFSVLSVPPDWTDAQIRFGGSHMVYVPQATLREELVVMLPGSGGGPYGHQRFMEAAADLGFPVIGLTYHNPIPVSVYCKPADTDKCTSDIRLEKQDGVDASAVYDICGFDTQCVDEPSCEPDPNCEPTAESVHNRLLKLLMYLESSDPGGVWGRYYAGESILWNRVIVAGWSQGGGQSVWISATRKVARSISFGQVGDARWRPYRPSDWSLLPRPTPSDRLFFMYHDREAVDRIAQDVAQAQNMWGAEKIDESDTELDDFECSHTLVSALKPHGLDPHAVYIADFGIHEDHLFHLRQAWSYLLTAEQSGTPGLKD